MTFLDEIEARIRRLSGGSSSKPSYVQGPNQPDSAVVDAISEYLGIPKDRRDDCRDELAVLQFDLKYDSEWVRELNKELLRV